MHMNFMFGEMLRFMQQAAAKAKSKRAEPFKGKCNIDDYSSIQKRMRRVRVSSRKAAA